MPGTTWSKWFWSDWMTDKGLRSCSLAARGLWMDMLCIAAEADPPGYVAVNGNGLDTRGIASIVGKPVEEVQPLLDELFHSGVYSVTRSGVIFNRRIIRDEKRRLASSKGGKSGGRQAVENKRGIFSTPDTTPPPTPHSTPDTTPPPMDKAISHKPEREENLIESESTPPRATTAGTPTLLDRMREAAGGRLDENSTGILNLAPILGLIAAGADVDRDILPAIREHVPRLKNPLRSWSAPWLHEEITTRRERRLKAAGVAGIVPLAVAAAEFAETASDQTWRILVGRYLDTGGGWEEAWGMQPGHPRCPVPERVLEEVFHSRGRDLTAHKRRVQADYEQRKLEA